MPTTSCSCPTSRSPPMARSSRSSSLSKVPPMSSAADGRAHQQFAHELRYSRASCSRSAGASTPTTSRCRPTCRAMMREADAALLIGDEALRAYWEQARRPASSTTSAPSGRRGPGCPWSTRSGRCAATSPPQQPDAAQAVVDALARSLTYCRAHLDDISEYAARWEQLPRASSSAATSTRSSSVSTHGTARV